MCGITGLRVTGFVVGILMLNTGVLFECFYVWKTVEVAHCSSNLNTTDYDPCLDTRNDSDVCYYNELEVRTYVGLAESIMGTATAICLIIGFTRVIVPLLWVWVVWALGITGYNAYCVYDYLTTIRDLTADCVDESEFWNVFIDQDYAHFFIAVTTSLCCYGVALCIVIPLAAIITKMVGPNSATLGTYELQERKNS